MTDKDSLERKLMIDYLQTRAKYFNEDVGVFSEVLQPDVGAVVPEDESAQ